MEDTNKATIDEKQFVDSDSNDFSYDLLYTIGTTNAQISAIRDTNKANKKILNNALKNPNDNAKDLQGVSKELTLSNGQLKELIMYKSSILTYDHFIMPLDSSKYINQKSLRDARKKASKQVEKYNLKYNSKWITQKIIENGEIYLELVNGKNNYLFFEFPTDMCKMTRKIGNMVSQFAINLNYLNESNYYKFPQDISDLYIQRKSGTLDKSKIIEKNWYQLEGLNHVAFSLENWEQKGVPYYSHLFDSLYSLSELTDLINLNAYIDSFRMLHQKPEVDDRGIIKMERKKIANYHEALKKIAPYGYYTITSPLDINLLSSKGDYSSTIEAREKAKSAIYDASGVNDNIFNGNTTNTEAVSIGFTIDTLLPLRIQKSIENWVNDHMRTVRATSNWYLEFVTTNEYNKGLEAERQRNALTVYSPKWKYLATIGLTPLRAISTIESEELEGIADYMKPLLTAYTQTGDEGGRPTNAEDGKSNANSSDNNPNE